VRDFATIYGRNNGIGNFGPPIEAAMRFNAGIISAFQSATVSWMQRRQEAAKEGIESFGRLLWCRDIGEVIAIQREWLERSLHRLDEDFHIFSSQAPDILARIEGVGVRRPIPDAAAQSAASQNENQSHAEQHSEQNNSRTEKKAPTGRAKSSKPSSGGRRR
jgi:hypothetical protein